MSDKKDIPTAEIKADEPILAKKEYAKTERSKSEQGAEKMNTSSNGTPKTDAPKTETVVVKKGGAGFALHRFQHDGHGLCIDGRMQRGPGPDRYAWSPTGTGGPRRFHRQPSSAEPQPPLAKERSES